MSNEYVCDGDVCYVPGADETAPAQSSGLTLPSASPEHWTIYGRPGCGFCTRAQEFLSHSACVYHNLEPYQLTLEETQAQLGVPESHRTVPIIFYQGTFVGGHQELVANYEKLTSPPSEEPLESLETTSSAPSHMSVPGGFSETKDLTQDLTELVESLKDQILARVATETDTFRPVSCRTQVVAGLNALVKVEVNSATHECVHVKLYRPLPHTGNPSEVKGHEFPKTLEDELATF